MSFVQTCSEFGRINTIQTKRLVFPFHRESYVAMLKVTCNEHMAFASAVRMCPTHEERTSPNLQFMTQFPFMTR